MGIQGKAKQGNAKQGNQRQSDTATRTRLHTAECFYRRVVRLACKQLACAVSSRIPSRGVKVASKSGFQCSLSRSSDTLSELKLPENVSTLIYTKSQRPRLSLRPGSSSLVLVLTLELEKLGYPRSQWNGRKYNLYFSLYCPRGISD